MDRPIGVKRAKKGKHGAVAEEVKELVQLLVDAAIGHKEDLDEVKAHQAKIAEQKIEHANLLLKVAEEKSRAKMLEHREKMLDKLNQMLVVDTSQMEPWAKEAHVRASTLLMD